MHGLLWQSAYGIGNIRYADCTQVSLLSQNHNFYNDFSAGCRTSITWDIDIS